MAAAAQDIAPPSQQVISAQIGAIIHFLQTEADDRVARRRPIEQRWIEDLRQFHGVYDPEITKDLRDAKRSTLFINQTRPKTNAMEARLSDMLFPTDERNWSIGPTPVPELTVEAEEAAKAAAAAAAAAAADPENPEAQAADQQASQHLTLIKTRMEEAQKRARAMEEEIDDHLRECNYAAQSRLVIRDACKIGTGVIKGPVTDGKSRRCWKKVQIPPAVEGQPPTEEFQLTYGSDSRPAFWRVDPWGFFPDMDAATMEECESVFERHLLNKKQLRALGRQPGFDKNAIRRLLQAGPNGSFPEYFAELRAITSDYTDLLQDRYQVWEYNGPLTGEELEWLSYAMGQEGEDFLNDLGDFDPLDELQVVVWFCQGELLKLGIHTLDSCESLYSVFNLEKDEATLFGFGVPYIMRDPQKSLAAAWRTLMDNMGISSGPQIVIDENEIEPADGQWIIAPRKVWKRKTTGNPAKKPFEIFNIESRMDEIMTIIEVSKRNVDEETALPMLAQGDQGTQVTKTLGGMAILMNSVNVVFRRIIKNWDDDVTIPNIRRQYDWLMQFSPKEHIKGDYQVDARGTSVLLVREIQSANLLAFLTSFGTHPNLAKYLKREGVPGLRRLAQVMMIPQDELVKTDDEIAQDEAKRAKAPPVIPPEVQKIVAEMNLKKDIALIERETTMMKLAAEMNLTVEQLSAMLRKARMEIESKERIFAAEAAIEAAQPDDAKGSGGYVS